MHFMTNDALLGSAESWFSKQSWQPFAFQRAAWLAYLEGREGLVNAPTGSGKTYSLLLPILLQGLYERQMGAARPGVQAIWITPVRALAGEIQMAAKRALQGLGLEWEVAVRNGDTGAADRQRQKKKPPEILILTPESLHLLLATKGYPQYFQSLKALVCDEWHELLGSKRGVQVELAISRLRSISPRLKVWGISATIGNLEEALAVLLGPKAAESVSIIIRADIEKKIEVQTLLPDEIERFPWAGHLGLRMVEKVLPIIEQSKSTLLFANTRSQCEIWYRQLLDVCPDLAGVLAMHHGALSRELRDWVENALHEGILKAVVCTSSLDLGVDFRPVETIVQIGSPKGVARCMQRAGRSGHQPGALSRIFFAPTHSLELVEGAALRQAIASGQVESRTPYVRCFDVLAQYLLTLAISEGFHPEEILREVQGTFAFESISRHEWDWVLSFIRDGGAPLQAYDEFKKAELGEDGVYRVHSRRTAMQHRMQIGTIVSDAGMQVQYVSGGQLGTIEERFVGLLKPGDVFWFAGKNLELVRIKEMTVQVRASKQKDGKVPSWLGGRLPWSSQMGEHLRLKIDEAATGSAKDPELFALEPLFALQRRRSHLPRHDELLLEYFSTKEGFHLMVYPFEGRFVHEGMSALLAYRISKLQPISFSIAMNDYGFELLSDSEIPVEEALRQGLFSIEALGTDIENSLNATELARRRFRDIAGIAGLVFKGYPGKQKKDRHVQASSQLFFEVFKAYEPDNLLLQQAYEEARLFQLEEARLREALQRIASQRIVLARPAKATPFAFPILVDRLRVRLSSEKLEDRIRKMQKEFAR
jgi:ATP-dependent Lhr-like helicase